MASMFYVFLSLKQSISVGIYHDFFNRYQILNLLLKTKHLFIIVLLSTIPPSLPKDFCNWSTRNREKLEC